MRKWMLLLVTVLAGVAVGEGDIDESDMQPLDVSRFTTYKHPSGFSFGHPDGWDVQTTAEGVLLLPDDAPRDAAGEPTEAFVLGGEEAAGIRAADDPQVLAYFRSLYEPGGFTYAGAGEALENAVGKAAVYRFDGRLPGGDALRHTIYINIHQGLGVFMIHMAAQERAERREPVARAGWSTLGRGAPQFDMNVVGEWHHSRTAHSASPGASVGSTTRSMYRFQSDGRVDLGVTSRVDGHNPGVIVTSEGGGDMSSGTFHTHGDSLTITWDNGNISQYTYSVFMHSDGRPALRLQRADWERPRFYR